MKSKTKKLQNRVNAFVPKYIGIDYLVYKIYREQRDLVKYMKTYQFFPFIIQIGDDSRFWWHVYINREAEVKWGCMEQGSLRCYMEFLPPMSTEEILTVYDYESIAISLLEFLDYVY